jgi:Mlc titration factor MtfA (ptsG expression regulator)
MEFWPFFIIIGLPLVVTIYLVLNFLLALADDLHIAAFHRPIYIHFYTNYLEISENQENILVEKFEFYTKLSNKRKKYFNHRMSLFLEKYEFISRENFAVTEEIQVTIAATYVMLTFGMRHYLLAAFDKIIIYPETYYSSFSDQYHKGEYNPRMKAVVFSWKHFHEGLEHKNDNLNLGIHEFTHVVHHHSLQSQDASSLTFKKHYQRILNLFTNPISRQKLIDSEYFRVYAFTNQFEFISVVIEHFFETPNEFKAEFPLLFKHVSRMLNHRHW